MVQTQVQTDADDIQSILRLNYYEILNVAPDATEEEIDFHFQQFLTTYEPNGASQAVKSRAARTTNAYVTLSDSDTRTLYDTYGETGAMMLSLGLPRPAMELMGGRAVAALAAVALVVIMLPLLIIWLAFLAAYCDGRLETWDYVKVCSPLFVIDIFLLVPTVAVAVLRYRALLSQPRALCILLSTWCLMITTIVVPNVLDHNVAVAATGQGSKRGWTASLIPGYLFSGFLFLAEALRFPSAAYCAKIRARGQRRLATYLPISHVMRLVSIGSLFLYMILLARRADGTTAAPYGVAPPVLFMLIAGWPFVDTIIIAIVSALWAAPHGGSVLAGTSGPAPTPTPAVGTEATPTKTIDDGISGTPSQTEAAGVPVWPAPSALNAGAETAPFRTVFMPMFLDLTSALSTYILKSECLMFVEIGALMLPLQVDYAVKHGEDPGTDETVVLLGGFACPAVFLWWVLNVAVLVGCVRAKRTFSLLAQRASPSSTAERLNSAEPHLVHPLFFTVFVPFCFFLSIFLVSRKPASDTHNNTPIASN